MRRLAGLSSASEERLAIPSFERLPYQNCPKCNYDIGYMRDKFRENHIYMFCKRGRRECSWRTTLPLSSMQEPSSSARPSAAAGDSPGPRPSAVRPKPSSAKETLTHL